ncbi:MAG: alpha/beta hydrolase domain-containing protein, partial [Desulfatiglandaceae bacterium]
DVSGNGFIQDRGFMLAAVNWELSKGIQLPSYTDDQGKKRYIEGVGFAAIRDFVMFLKMAKQDDAGNANPLAGAVKKAIGVGYSQTARFLKTTLIHGFNTNRGEIVLDGMHIHAGHAGILPIMTAGTGPSSSGNGFPTFRNPNFPNVTVEPFTYQDIVQKALDRKENLPKMIVTHTTSDYYIFRTSLSRTGASGTVDAPIPQNVRVYDLAGGAHIIMNTKGCKNQPGKLDWHPVMRAVIVRLNEWITTGTLPPDNNLSPLEARPGDPMILGSPEAYPESIVMVPKTDEDGNDIGGVRLPELEVPLGTYAGNNEPLTSVLCTMSTSFIPFVKSKPKRLRMGDSRLSIRERYKNKNDYVGQIAQAAWSLVEQGFMLERDAYIIIDTVVATKVVK